MEDIFDEKAWKMEKDICLFFMCCIMFAMYGAGRQ